MRLGLVVLIALAVIAHHGAAVPLPGASGHGGHGICHECQDHGGDGTAAAGFLAVCLGLAATGLALQRIAASVTRLRALSGRVRRGTGARWATPPPRPPPRPPDLTRLCVLLR
jgi:hypothetical protein